MITTKTLQNANKLTYLIEAYPDNSMTDVIALLEMPAIDINTAIWAAVELGWIMDPKTNEGVTGLLKKPETWDFGPELRDLEDNIVYAFTVMGKLEADLEEYDLSQWTAGYAKHDLAIIMKLLLADKVLASYEVEDTNPENDSIYTFYTLYANREHEWGRKQYKDAVEADAKAKKRREKK